MLLRGREWGKSVNPKKARRSMNKVVKSRNHCKRLSKTPETGERTNRS